jgi:hypothetical protein
VKVESQNQMENAFHSQVSQNITNSSLILSIPLNGDAVPKFIPYHNLLQEGQE